MFVENPVITRMEKDGKGYFTLRWSKLQKADKYVISSSVPAISGIYEMYYQDKAKALNLLTVSQGWYGGLRSQIREAIDETFQKDPKILRILASYPIYFRYTTSEVLADMKDVLWFLTKTYYGDKISISHSDRYSRIFLTETAPDRVHWI